MNQKEQGKLPEQTARVFQINLSKGGVPKTGVHEAVVSTFGLEGDAQKNPGIHGGPERALCLYSLEHIAALQAEGHLVFPGSLGENLTLNGLPWQELVPGAQLRVGDQALLELTSYTAPCNTIRGSFTGGDYSRISQRKYPGWSRLYARVLQPGKVKVGDQVQLLKKTT
jgi:MOSC domain-containing protein YiiM